MAARGWQWTEYTTSMEGYIPAKSLSKNFELELDTFVRAERSTTATVLTLVEAGDHFEVLKSDDTWATVRFRKAVPVYFLQSEMVAPAAKTNSPAPIAPLATSSLRPSTSPSISRFDPSRRVSTATADALPPENVIWSSAPASTAPIERIEPKPVPVEPINMDDIMVGPAETQAREAPREPEIQPGTPMRLLSGKLVRVISSFGPRYPIRLNTVSGKRVAYVDMSNIFINDLRPYLDQMVYIHGEVRPLVPGSKDLVILARTIRIGN
jgi:hypothetical protein